jgi:Leucine-rich repeat (LRR) protein
MSAASAQPAPANKWPVPMRVMAWTADGVEEIGQLPASPPAAYPARWYVEPTRAIDTVDMERIVLALREEHVPGLSLRDQRDAAVLLGYVRDLPELTALLLDDTAVDSTAIATLNQPLERLYLARTEVDDAGIVALAAWPAFAHLAVLDLEDCNITDKGAKAITALTELHALNLSGTRITDAGGAALGALKQLAVVDLGDTRVGARTVAALRPRALTELFLDRTFAGKELATLAGYAPGLVRFDVSSLQIYKPTDADLAWLAQAPNLAEVGLSGAKVHDKLVQAIAAAPKLRRLRLAGTPITLPTIQAIAKRGELEQVDLAETPIDDASAAALLAMPKMRVLRLDRTMTSDAALRGPVSPELTELYVSTTRVTDAGLELLDRAPRLEALGTGALGLGDAALARIAKLTDLATLVLSQAKASPAALAGLTELRTLHLAQTEVSEEALPVLRAFAQLDELTVGDTRMHGGITDLSTWPQLRTLSLQGLDVTDASPLARRSSLVTLDLSYTEIKDLAPLAKLPNLRTLGAVGLRLSPAGEAAAKAIAARGVEVVQ